MSLLVGAIAGALATAHGCAANGEGSPGGHDAASLGDECAPLADDCAAGTYCQHAGGRLQCVDEGSIARDELCGDESCQRGSICLRGAEPGELSFCQQPCDLNDDTSTPCDITRHTCFPAIDDAGNELSFGVCRYVQ
jgi:hypothetical protein